MFCPHAFRFPLYIHDVSQSSCAKRHDITEQLKVKSVLGESGVTLNHAGKVNKTELGDFFFFFVIHLQEVNVHDNNVNDEALSTQALYS